MDFVMDLMFVRVKEVMMVSMTVPQLVVTMVKMMELMLVLKMVMMRMV
jgi:hypothetical protein